MANEPESQAGFQLGSGPNDLTRQSPQPAPPKKAIFGSPQPIAPPVMNEQFPLYDPTAPAGLQSVKPSQAGYTLPEYSRDVVIPPPKPSPAHPRRIIVGIVAAVVGAMIVFGMGYAVWEDSYDPGPVPEVIYEGADAGWLEPGQDYGYQDWRGSDMSNLDLTASSFVESDLRNVTLSYANLTAADFTDADLRGASMDNVTASGATFEDTDLRGAILSGATFQGANLEEADLRGANLAGTDFSGVNLDDVDFAGATYDDATVWPTGFIIPAGAVKI